MDTLKRVGSLRMSKRGRKNKDQDRKSEDDRGKGATSAAAAAAATGTLLPEPPRFYATLGRKEKSAKAFFTVSFKDVSVTTLNGYQPTHLRAIFERHRRARSSDPVLWEPSLKCTSSGSGVWHPPFIIHVAISVPKLSKAVGDSVTLRQKDAFISLENVDLKGKRKLLAKARLNLSEYFESAAETDVSFRLKLHPESSKVASSSVEITLRKSVHDPTKENVNSAPCLYDDETGSLSDMRILTPSQKSLESISPTNSVKDDKVALAVAEDTDDIELQPGAMKRPASVHISPKKEQEPLPLPVATDHVVGKNIVPNIITPPPLPPRQKVIAPESPPSSPKHMQNVITSTPLTSHNRPQDLNVTAGHATSSSGKTSPAFLSPAQPNKEGKSPTKRSPTPVKQIDWNEDDTGDAVSEEPQSIGISVSACASPKVSKQTDQSKVSAEKELIEWAKSALKSAKPQVKVTNLTSSWRNGLGFCLILHKSYPSLIPLQELSSEQSRDNNEIAFDVADMFGIDTEAIRGMALVDEVTDKTTVSEFLRQIRLLKQLEEISKETVIEFQKKWFRRGKYFRSQVGQLCMEEDAAKAAKETSSELLTTDSAISSVVEGGGEPDFEDNLPKGERGKVKEDDRQQQEEVAAANGGCKVESSPSSTAIKEQSEECSNSRQRVRKLIAMAHDSSSYDDASPSPEVSSTSEVGNLCESGTILEELSQLARDQEQICAELEKLELTLRNQDMEEIDGSDFEAFLQRYVSMVNEKNSLVQRQMQLNIAEKERAIEHKKEKLQRQLQKFSDLDESQKSEAMRLEEEMLLQQYVEAVNEKNELVHDMDSQEKLIAEDERIRSFIANRDMLTSAKTAPDGHKHNLINEFLDFFKAESKK